MTFAPISKAARPGGRDANLRDYEAACAQFSWAAERAGLDGLPGGGVNITHEAVDRHAARTPDRIAIRWLGKTSTRQELSYGWLAAQTSRFANALGKLGIEPGDRVFALLGRLPALYVAALGTLKHRAVFSPLFSAFGPDPIRTRVQIGAPRVLVTTERIYAKKIAPIRGTLDSIEHVIVVREDPRAALPPNTLDWDELLAAAPDTYAIGATRGEDPALLHFTSGTTGTPKGALHVHDAVLMHYVTGKYALDLHPGDVFWCTADPGWVTGTSYGIIAPLVHGVTMLVDEAEFDAERWYDLLARERVAVWYTAPTAIRMLMRGGAELARKRSYPALRFMASEPLAPDAVVWGLEAFGQPFHDNWWQTETGGIMISNFAAMEVRPGSMGRPLPGVSAAIVAHTTSGGIQELVEPNVEGELALRPGWPSMFRAYWNSPERYAKCFVDGWYLTGDLARRDGDGYFWFVGRADDVIKTAGHLVGPFELEAVLTEHPAVAEAAVIGKPDPVAGEIVNAERRILADVRSRLGDLGQEIGISRERVRQLEVRVMRKMRAAVLEACG